MGKLKSAIEVLRSDKSKLETQLKEALNRAQDAEKAKGSMNEMRKSFSEQDDYSMLLVENENLKKQIMLLKSENAKRELSDKLEKKLVEKDAELSKVVDQHKEAKAMVVV